MSQGAGRSAAQRELPVRAELVSRRALSISMSRETVSRKLAVDHEANARSVDDSDARIAYMRPSKRAAALWGDQQ